MNIVQEFYEDFIKPKPKVPKAHKRMDDQIQNQSPVTPELPQEPVVETPVVEEEVAPVEETPIVEPVEEARPAEFNCSACKGTGLKDSYTVCPNCKGTGKV